MPEYGNKPVPVPVERLPEIQASAVEHHSALVNKFGPAMEDRLNTVIATRSGRNRID
jgi:hypothetical protein